MRKTSVERKRESLPEIALLPSEQKEQLVLDLFKEFGVTQWRKQGDELIHRCSLNLGGHTDGNSWSASVNYRTMKFNCLVCHNAGSITWWIAVNRGEESQERIVSWLKKSVGLNEALELRTLNAVIDGILHPKSDKEPLPYYDDRLLLRWHQDEGFHPYLTAPIESGGRGILEDNLRRFDVGYVSSDEDFKYVQRIILPARWEGNLVGWQARTIPGSGDPDAEVKYKNSPGFPRSSILYGDVERNRNVKVVVEAPMSVLKQCHNADLVSTFGSKVTDTQLRLLSRYDELIIFMDPDKAGYSATRHILNKLGSSVIMSVVDNPYKNDPADMDDYTFLYLLATAVPCSVWTPKRYSELKTL